MYKDIVCMKRKFYFKRYFKLRIKIYFSDSLNKFLCLVALSRALSHPVDRDYRDLPQKSQR